jgi:hypothetical protein
MRKLPFEIMAKAIQDREAFLGAGQPAPAINPTFVIRYAGQRYTLAGSPADGPTARPALLHRHRSPRSCRRSSSGSSASSTAGP